MSIGILGKFQKQPSEVKSYKFDFTDFLADKGDTIAGCTVTAEPGLSVDSVGIAGGIVLAMVSSGTNGTTYKITCRATTAGGLIEEAEIQVKVKET